MPLRGALIVCLGASLAPVLAHAAGDGPAIPVTFAEALGLAEANPRVQAATQAQKEKRGWNDQMGRLSANPTVTVSPGARFLPGAARGLEWRLAIDQPIPVGLAGARRTSALAEGRTLGARVDVARLAARLEAAFSWIELWTAERIFEEAQKEVGVAEDVVRVIDRAVKAAERTRADLVDAQGFVAEARRDAIHAEGMVTEAALALSRERGGPFDRTLTSQGSLPTPPLPDGATRARWLAKSDTYPDVVLRTLEREAERARLVEERTLRGTIVRVGVEAERDLPGGFVMLGTLGVSLPLFERGARERGTRAADVALLSGERERDKREGIFTLAVTLHEIDHKTEELAQLEKEVLPLANEAAKLRQILLSAGEGTVIETLFARRAVIAALRKVHRTRGDLAWASVKTWLFGRTIEPGETR